MSPDWSGRGEVALYPRNEFFFHRSDHNGRTGRRIAPYIRGVYCGSPDRDGNQPDIQVYSIITPLVSGIVVLLIGLSLIKVGVVSCGGGYGAMDNGTFGSIRNIGVAATVLLSVLFFNRCKNKYLRMSSIVLGLCIGYALAYFLGMVDMAAASSQSLMGFNIPMPFKYGLDQIGRAHV